jgi:hypothetical protein
MSDMGITVTRLAGADRTATATKVADWELANQSFSTTTVDLARGDDFPDALSASAHGGKAKAPLLLASNPNDIGSATRAWLAGHAGTLKDGHIDGGTAAISQAAENDATGAATTGTTTTSTNPLGTLLTTTTTAPGGTTTTSPIGGLTTTTAAGGSTTTTTTPTSQLQQCPPGQTGPGEPFCFASAPATPAFASASATDTPTSQITLTYNKAVACNSVDADGSDYTVVLDGATVTATASCLGTSSTTIRLTPAATLAPGDGGTVTAKAGVDTDTVKDTTGNAQAVGDKVTYADAAPAAPKLVSAATTAGSATMTLTYDQKLNCTTVDANGSDYTISVTAGPSPSASIAPASATCSGKTVTLTLGSGNFQSTQQGKVTVKAGSDSDTVANYAAQAEAAGDSANYTVA